MDFVQRIRRRLIGGRALLWLMAVAVGTCAGIWGGRVVLEKLTGSIAIVQGSSMVPTFEPGARIYTERLEGSVRRGEIVLIKDGSGGCAIKRVIGLPGEKIHLWRGYVFVDGHMLVEPYLPKYTFTHPDQDNNRSAFALGSGNYFVMGDNRLCSHDSRSYGPILVDQIKSVVAQVAGPAPEFAPFALPVHGRQTIRPLALAEYNVLRRGEGFRAVQENTIPLFNPMPFGRARCFDGGVIKEGY